MTSEHEPSKLDEILAEYLQRVEAGESVDREALLQQHPELADELREFLADDSQWKRVACAGDSGLSPTIGASQSSASDVQFAPTFDSKASSGAPDAPTQRVGYFGDYELLEEIARGGMGVVYKARQMNLNRVVALKMILAGQLAGEQDVQRFHAEAEAAAALDHPNIVPIFEVGEHEGQHFFSMGYVEGESLADRIADGPLPPDEAAELVQTIAEAIHYAHEKGVIHRDLKPANVLLQAGDGRQGAGGRRSDLQPPVSNLQPKVTDFGLAKRTEGASELTGTGQILGTPSYMPPEQASGKTKEIGAEADVYSLGAILYAAITGHPPFQAANPLDTLMQVIRNEPPPPRQLNPQTPRDLETICLKCLQKEPHKRYESAQALADELARWLAGKPILARPVGRTERAVKLVRRHPIVSGLIGTTALALIGGTIVSSFFAVQAEIAADAEREARQEAEANESEATSLAVEQQRLKAVAEERSRRAERLLYDARINLVQRAWENGQVRNMRELLSLYADSSSANDLRGWEWHFLWRQCQKQLAIFPDESAAVAFSPDSQYLATSHQTSNNSGEIRIWDLATSERRATFEVKTSWAVALAFDSQGDQIVAAQANGTVSIHFLEGGTEATAQEGAAEISGGLGIQVAISPGGELVASCGNDFLQVWDVRQARVLHSFKLPQPSSPAFDANGRRVLVRSSGGGIHVWHCESGESAGEIHEKLWGWGCALSPDGKRIAAVRYPSDVELYEVETGRRLHSFRGHSGIVMHMEFSRDGVYLISGDDVGTIRVWNADDGTSQGVLGGQRSLNALAFSPDGSRFASAGDDTRLWATLSGSPQRLLTYEKNKLHNIQHFDFTPTGNRVVAGTSNAKMLDVESGRVHWSIAEPHTRRNVSALCIDAQGRYCATSGYDQHIVLWDVRTGEKKQSWKTPVIVAKTMDFSPDGRWLVAGGISEWDLYTEIELWDVTNGEMVLAWNKPNDRIRRGMKPEEMEAMAEQSRRQEAHSIRFSPDGRMIASGHSDGAVRMWNIEAEILSTFRGHKAPVATVAFSPDGKFLASGSWDHTIRIHDIQGQLIHVLRGHTGLVLSVAFSPDGERLCSSGRDGMLKIWDAKTGQELLTLDAVNRDQRLFQREVWGAGFFSDGELLAAGGPGIRLWSGAPLTPQEQDRRESLWLLEYLREQSDSAAQLQEKVRTMKGISDPVRAKTNEILTTSQEIP